MRESDIRRLPLRSQHFGEDGDVVFALDEGAEAVHSETALKKTLSIIEARISYLDQSDVTTIVMTMAADGVNLSKHWSTHTRCIFFSGNAVPLFFNTHNLLPDIEGHGALLLNWRRRSIRLGVREHVRGCVGAAKLKEKCAPIALTGAQVHIGSVEAKLPMRGGSLFMMPPVDQEEASSKLASRRANKCQKYRHASSAHFCAHVADEKLP